MRGTSETLETDIDWDWRPNALSLVVDYSGHFEDCCEWDEVRFNLADGPPLVLKYEALDRVEQDTIQDLVTRDFQRRIDAGDYDSDFRE